MNEPFRELANACPAANGLIVDANIGMELVILKEPALVERCWKGGPRTLQGDVVPGSQAGARRKASPRNQDVHKPPGHQREPPRAEGRLVISCACLPERLEGDSQTSSILY